jgi:hypothetical protein
MKRLLKLIDGKKTVIGVAILALAKVMFPDQVTMTPDQIMNAMHALPVQSEAVSGTAQQITQGGGAGLFIIGIIHHIVKAWKAKV